VTAAIYQKERDVTTFSSFNQKLCNVFMLQRSCT